MPTFDNDSKLGKRALSRVDQQKMEKAKTGPPNNNTSPMIHRISRSILPWLDNQPVFTIVLFHRLSYVNITIHWRVLYP